MVQRVERRQQSASTLEGQVLRDQQAVRQVLATKRWRTVLPSTMVLRQVVPEMTFCRIEQDLMREGEGEEVQEVGVVISG